MSAKVRLSQFEMRPESSVETTGILGVSMKLHKT